MRERHLRSLNYLNTSQAQGYKEFAALSFLQQIDYLYRQLILNHTAGRCDSTRSGSTTCYVACTLLSHTGVEMRCEAIGLILNEK